MPGERLKFRCYQCNQLLASSPGKAGSIVACPRCKADLVVPVPEAAAAAESQTASGGKSSGRAVSTLAPARTAVAGDVDEVAASIPDDLADLRPEDLRVEAEFFKNLTREPAPESPKGPDPFPVIAQEPPPPAPPYDPRPTPAPVPSLLEVGVPATPTNAPEPPGAVPWLATIRPNPDVPPIEIEHPTVLNSQTETRPLHDVVLPASVVLAWSLFALIGIATSFIAGLMVGHYFWKM